MSSILPSKAQIAFALILLKSKPPEMEVENYVREVQSHVVQRPRKVPVESEHYIDGTRFWKMAYERMEAENSSLLDKIFVLEQRHSKSLTPEHTIPTTAKRKSEASGTTKANIQSKRRNVASEAPSEALDSNIELIMESKPPGHRLLLRSFYELQSSTSTHSQDTSATCQSIKSATYRVGQTMSATFRSQALPSKACPQTPAFAEICRVGLKIWISILHNLRIVEAHDPQMSLTCLPYITKLVQVFLGLIQQCCLDEADKAIKSRKKTKSKSIKNAAMSNASLLEETKTLCKSVSSLLCQMFTALDLNVATHRSIMETSICSLFDHIGSSMSLLIFVEKNTPIQKQQGILPPCGLLDVAHIDSETAILTSQLAAPYLVQILQQVIAIMNRMTPTQQSQMIKLDGTDGDEGAAAVMMNKLRHTLQSTLLRGVYGDDATFKQALDRGIEADTVDMEKVFSDAEKGADLSEWFIGQVWEHLGWDVLVAE